jgi:hypothetical protein
VASIARDEAYVDYDDDEAGLGWITFAGVMLAMAGTFNVIDGLVALAKSKFYVGGAVFVFGDLRTWGWIILVVGVLEGVAAAYLFTGSQWARWFGIGAATVNALAQLMFIQAYPFWSLAIFAADVAIIYGLAVHGARERVQASMA